MFIFIIIGIVFIVGFYLFAKKHSTVATKTLVDAGFPNNRVIDGIVYDEVNKRIADISCSPPIIINIDQVRSMQINPPVSKARPTIRILYNNSLHFPYHDIGFFSEEAQQKTAARLSQLFDLRNR